MIRRRGANQAELIRSLDRYIVFDYNFRQRPVKSHWGLRGFRVTDASQNFVKKRLGQKHIFFAAFLGFLVSPT